MDGLRIVFVPGRPIGYAKLLIFYPRKTDSASWWIVLHGPAITIFRGDLFTLNLFLN